jgi:hypothetical protein
MWGQAAHSTLRAGSRLSDPQLQHPAAVVSLDFYPKTEVTFRAVVPAHYQ